MKKRFLYTAFAVFALASFTFTSCSNDDDDQPTGNAVISIENVTTVKDFVQSGTFQMTGTSQPEILPGESVSITFNAAKGQVLMFATMYGYSNDIFFAPENTGINLFNSDGVAITGDVSSQVKLWDNGTRINQAPGSEVTHPGTAELGNVEMIKDNKDAQGNTYPEASELMKLTLAYTAATSEFTLTIANISGGKVNETPFSPGVWVVPNKLGSGLVNGKPFFAVGERSSDELTALAESGDNEALYNWAQERTGIITDFSPTLVVVYSGNTNPLYQLNQKDAGIGMKDLAQAGNPNTLRNSLKAMSNVREVYIVGNEVLQPGNKAESTFMAWDGDNIAFATMFGYGNDWFFANGETISSVTKGDITNKVVLLDNGTGVSQYPGAGNSQALFDGIPAAEDKAVTAIDRTTYPAVPAVNEMIKVVLR